MAIAQLQIYKCGVCGNEIEVLCVGGGTLTCCDKPMIHLAENTTDAAQEKHVPVVEKIDGGIKVKIGSVAHPMDEKHYIRWIELLVDGHGYREFFAPGAVPEATFSVTGQKVAVRAECNLHGLWGGE